MRRAALPVAVVLSVWFCLSAVAVDRDARMIDTIRLEYGELNDADLIGLKIWGENALLPERGPWAILFGGRICELSGEAAEDGDLWNIFLGIKYYIFPETSAVLQATYGEVDWHRSYDVRGVEMQLVHRFLPAEEPMSPFVRGAAGLKERGRFGDPVEPDEDKDGVQFEVGAGIDFQSNEELSFVFEAALIEGENLHGEIDISDGWILSFGMKYHWFR